MTPDPDDRPRARRQAARQDMANTWSRPTTFLAGFALGCLLTGVLGVLFTQAPLPFVDRGLRKPADPSLSRPAPAPDPAAPLTGLPPPTPTPDDTRLQSVEPDRDPSREATAPAITTTPDGAPKGRLYLQAGAYRQSEEADRQRAQLALLGLEARSVKATAPDGSRLLRVWIGPFPTMDDLNQTRSVLSDNGISSTVVRGD